LQLEFTVDDDFVSAYFDMEYVGVTLKRQERHELTVE
jgi:hypothetical protein